MTYLTWDKKTITDFSPESLASAYSAGYVATRVGRGVMDQTRSLRIDLSRFELSSENRRILKKVEGLRLEKKTLPYADYHWSLGKLGKDFYETKFGEGTFSANKIKELLTDKNESSFTTLFVYHYNDIETVGYCIALETPTFTHYCYPFYKLDTTITSLGLGMMLTAIVDAKTAGKKYIYLGSAQRSSDTYKLQFEGLEWFDGTKWQTDTHQLKTLLEKA
jgi:arginyl-tRNA--protein-N-Asp/Glu arginylyltransferase